MFFIHQNKMPHVPWNKGRLIGQKPPLKPKHVWAIRTKLHMEGQTRDLALFNLAIDSKLRGSDLVQLRVEDIAPNGHIVDRVTVRQQKTSRAVTFEISEHSRSSLGRYFSGFAQVKPVYLFPSRLQNEGPISPRQYARLVAKWLTSIGLDPLRYGTHSLRRTKASLIYRKTGNLRAVQLLLGHSRIESTVKYLGIEVDDALEIAEKIEI